MGEAGTAREKHEVVVLAAEEEAAVTMARLGVFGVQELEERTLAQAAMAANSRCSVHWMRTAQPRI